ncbi:MAG: Abi family protein [Paracoccaceae bacterium]|nr:Abi family protein [Paracoccaceae bacterium]
MSIPEQLELLETRGMIVADADEAVSFLECVSYYRLRAYWRPFERVDNFPGEHAFQDDVDFGRIRNIYIFDQKLRILMLEGIERIGVAIRAIWANLMAEKYGSHGYLVREYYSSKNHHEKNVLDLHRAFCQSKDEFVNHYKATYTESYLPPVWIATELMSFGLLSKFVENLKFREDKNVMAHYFNLDERVLTSFLRHLCTVRNFCAHHGRVWNRRFTVSFRLPDTPAELSAGLNRDSRRYLYNTLVMIDYFLGFIVLDNQDDDWKENLIELINGNPQIDLFGMGFPNNWRSMDFWQ